MSGIIVTHTHSHRECTADASRVVMGSLTEHGVRMVMPLLLKSLEESQVLCVCV